jgi:CDP-diacylglycerol---glycerol-3-phosphate 3-phosphatidyltransferase
MLVRSLLRCSAPRQLVRCRQLPRPANGRRYSTASSTTPGGGVPHTAGQAPMLAAFTEELDKIAPRFDIRGDQVKVLRTPDEFYETLKVCDLKS